MVLPSSMRRSLRPSKFKVDDFSTKSCSIRSEYLSDNGSREQYQVPSPYMGVLRSGVRNDQRQQAQLLMQQSSHHCLDTKKVSSSPSNSDKSVTSSLSDSGRSHVNNSFTPTTNDGSGDDWDVSTCLSTDHSSSCIEHDRKQPAPYSLRICSSRHALIQLRGFLTRRNLRPRKNGNDLNTCYQSSKSAVVKDEYRQLLRKGYANSLHAIYTKLELNTMLGRWTRTRWAMKSMVVSLF
jgi:hypothetical protein